MEHTHLPGLDERGSDAARESIEPSEGVDLHRRAFLFGTAAVLAAHALPADADAAERKPLAGKAQPENKDVAPKPTLEKLEENTWIVRQSPTEENGEGMRGPSFIAPRGYDAVPIMTITRAEVDAPPEGMDQRYLLALPRDIGEIGRLETRVRAAATGLNNMVSDLEIVESQPNNNKFLSCRIQGTPTGGKVVVEMKVMSWMSQPKTPPLEGDALMRVNQRNQTLLKAMQLKVAAESNLTYDASTSPLDPAQIAAAKKGDCGTHAVFIEQASNGEFKTVIGYCALAVDKDTGKGGTHAFNLSRGNVRVDAPYHTYGVDRGEYVVEQVGTELNFPQGSGWEFASGKHKAFNRFAWSGNGRAMNGTTTLSVPGRGEASQVLTQMMQKTPPDITALNKEHEKSRKLVNSPANIKKIAAATPKK